MPDVPEHESQDPPAVAVEETPAQLPPTIQTTSAESDGEHDKSDVMKLSQEEVRPPLPPRPSGNLDLLDERSASGSVRLSKKASRPNLQARPTTAVFLTDVQTSNTYQDHGSPNLSPPYRPMSRKQSSGTLNRFMNRATSDAGETSSVRSFSNTLGYGGEMESLLGDVFPDQQTPAWKALSAQIEGGNPFDDIFEEDEIFSIRLHHEFDELEDFRADGSNEEYLMKTWAAKLKIGRAHV